MAECSFCGKVIPRGTGLLFVRKDGSVFYFCSSKCEKNLTKLGRTPHEYKWSALFSAQKEILKAKEGKAEEKPVEAKAEKAGEKKKKRAERKAVKKMKKEKRKAKLKKKKGGA